MRIATKYTSICLTFIAIFYLSDKASAECIKGNCINGQGIFVAKNGDKYVGEFLAGKYYGKGTYTWNDGKKYEGEFSGNRANGNGVFNEGNGNKYVGMFKNGKYHGVGTLTLPNGVIKSGVWENGGYLGTKLAWEEKERQRIAKERERIAKEYEEAEEKYESIYIACLLDKSKGLDMQISDIRNAIEEACVSIAKNPSLLERFKYN